MAVGSGNSGSVVPVSIIRGESQLEMMSSCGSLPLQFSPAGHRTFFPDAIN